MEADAAGSADRINVTGAPGTATLNGGTVEVQAGAGTYQASTTYTILNATGGVTGTFSGVTSNLAFLVPSLSYNANNVFLTLARNGAGFPSVAITRNQVAVADMLEPLANGSPTGDLQAVTSAITGLSAPQARAAFDAIGGAPIVELRRGAAAFAGDFGATLDARLRHPEAARVLVAGPAAWPAGPGRGFWIRGGTLGTNTEGDGNAAGSDLRGETLALGADTKLGEQAVAGVAFAAGRGRLGVDGASDRGRSRHAALGAYGQVNDGAFTYRGSATLALGNNRLDRSIAFGPIARTAHGEFDSRSLALQGEASVALSVAGVKVNPFAGATWTHTRSDAFTETGAGALDLSVGALTTQSLRTRLGARTQHDWGALRVEPRLAWVREHGDLNQALSARLAGAAFEVAGVQLKRDSLLAGLTLSGSVAKGAELFADVQVTGQARQSGYTLQAGLRMTW